jgi:hypothetical protein
VERERSILRVDLNSIDQRVVGHGNKRQFQHSVRSRFCVVENENCRAVLLVAKDVELLEQRLAVAIHVKLAAAYAGGATVAAAKPPSKK